MESTPVSRASFGTRCGGIRLQSCRRIVNLDAVGLVYLFFTSSKELTVDRGAWDELVANNSGFGVCSGLRCVI